ncbi:MAG: hypothetical protein KKA07_09215, partial [Bacteroidetes bacterium]|nr:hypothetical protein [Bacteroidota bacterium]
MIGKLQIIASLALFSLGGSVAGFAQTYTQSTTTYSWDSPTTDVTTTSCDGCSYSLTIPFTFTYFGYDYTSCNVVADGYMYFGSTTETYTNVCLPNSGTPNNLIACYWDDLYFDYSCAPTVWRYQTLGTAPNRRFVVSWVGFRRYGGACGNYVYTQIKLFETSNIIEVHVQSNTLAINNSGTIGIENSGGTVGYQAICNTNPGSSVAWQWTPCATTFYAQDFESTNGWTYSSPSGDGNYWVWGSGDAHSGTGSLNIWDYWSGNWYVSYDGYAGTSRDLSKTFDFSSLASADYVNFSYWLKCNGETNYDDLNVIVNGSTLQGPLTGITTYAQKIIDLTAYKGLASVTVIFRWRNDGGIENQPGARIDDVKITYCSSCTNPTITVHPSTSAANYCLNGGATALSVTAAPATGYQWYSNTISSNSGGTLIGGATSSSYTPLTTSAGTLYYYCIVSNSTCNTTSNVSGAITVFPVFNAGAMTGPASSTQCYNYYPTALAANPTGGVSYSYQWQSSPAGCAAWSNIGGATASTYDPPALTATTCYRVLVDATGSPDCGASTASTNTFTYTILGDFSAGAMTGPASSTQCYNYDPAVLTANPTGGAGTYTYQWQSSPAGCAAWSNIGGATASTYNPPALTATTCYRVLVDATGSPDCGAATASSNTFTYTILGSFSAGAIIGGGGSICPGGDPGNMTANPTGGAGSYSYLWYYKD